MTRKSHFEQFNTGKMITHICEMALQLARPGEPDSLEVVRIAPLLFRDYTGLTTPPTEQDLVAFEEIAAFAFIDAWGKFYRIGKDFGESLSTANLKVAVRYLHVTDVTYCIQFPDGMTFETLSGDHIFEAYVSVANNTRAKLGVGLNVGRVADKVLQIHFPSCYPDGRIRKNIAGQRLTVALNTDSIEDAILEQNESEHAIKFDCINFILKCLLYIQSGEPDLRHLKSRKHTMNDRKWKQFSTANKNESALDWTLVGYDFKKPKTYSVDQTIVVGHYRWQPYGTGLEKVKLVWIHSHLRTYKDGTTEGAQPT